MNDHFVIAASAIQDVLDRIADAERNIAPLAERDGHVATCPSIGTEKACSQRCLQVRISALQLSHTRRTLADWLDSPQTDAVIYDASGPDWGGRPANTVPTLPLVETSNGGYPSQERVTAHIPGEADVSWTTSGESPHVHVPDPAPEPVPYPAPEPVADAADADNGESGGLVPTTDGSYPEGAIPNFGPEDPETTHTPRRRGRVAE